MTRVLMVCTGNICRSVMAHTVLAQQAEERGVHGVEVDSAGVSDEEHGNPPDPRAQKVLREYGYEVPAHQARQIRYDDMERYDLILAMTDSHLARLRQIERMSGKHATIRLYRDFDSEGSGNVPDPWYGGMREFVDTMEVIERVTPALLSAIREGKILGENNAKG